MKVPLSWLNDFVPVTMAPEVLADRLTMRGLEVEGMERIEAAFADVLVGEIIEVQPHPGAEKLVLCKVDIGSDVVSVVCGAPNTAASTKVPIAPPGSRIADGTVLEKRKIRGVESFGMLCSERELGLSDDHSGLMILPGETKPGEPLEHALGVEDVIFDVNVPPNRGDCQSILGIAREVASILNQKITLPTVKLIESPNQELPIGLEILDLEACPRYVLRLIRDIKIVPAPFWMRDRITKCGMRPINAIVDVTNYVMLELGQPLHAFDYTRLAGHRIRVRVADRDMVFRTLDGTDRKLLAGDILIADGKGPVALAGVMGGENSEISATTTTVALESAFFNPLFIRRTARRLDLRSEASARFEKGIDIENVDFAARRAIALMHETAGGTVIAGSKEIYEERAPRTIFVTLKRMAEIIGIPVEREKAIKVLNSIDVRVVKKEREGITVAVPSFRHDLNEYIDVIEEVARTIGFENIPASAPVSRLLPVREGRTESFLRGAKAYLVSVGFFEAKSFGFFDTRDIERFLIPEADERANYVPLMNPISRELGVMRTFLTAGLLETLAYNVNRGTRNIRFFEAGKVFFKDETVREHLNLGLVMTGKSRDYFWRETAPDADFFDARGVLEGLLEPYGVNLQLRQQDEPFLEAGEAAALYIGDVKAGWVGKLRPEVLKSYGLDQPVYAAEIDFGVAAQAGTRERTYRPAPRYPAVTRDFSFTIDEGIAVGELIDIIKGVSPLVQSVGIFDMFKKEKRSVAFRVVFQSHEDTLRDEAVNELQAVIIRELTQREGIKLRT